MPFMDDRPQSPTGFIWAYRSFIFRPFTIAWIVFPISLVLMIWPKNFNISTYFLLVVNNRIGFVKINTFVFLATTGNFQYFPIYNTPETSIRLLGRASWLTYIAQFIILVHGKGYLWFFVRTNAMISPNELYVYE